MKIIRGEPLRWPSLNIRRSKLLREFYVYPFRNFWSSSLLISFPFLLLQSIRIRKGIFVWRKDDEKLYSTKKIVIRDGDIACKLGDVMEGWKNKRTTTCFFCRQKETPENRMKGSSCRLSHYFLCYSGYVSLKESSLLLSMLPSTRRSLY